MKVIRWLDKYLEAVFIAAGLVVMVAVMTAQIFYRKFFGASIIWSEELCRHIFICSACWGLAYSIRHRMAIKFDMIVNFFSERGRHIFEIISNAIVFVFFVYMFRASWNVVVSMRTTKATSLPYNLDVLYFVSLIGFVLSALRALQMIVVDIREIRLEQGQNKKEGAV